ncbi:MAG: hypothetical protein QM781_17860 [Chitinophagaceae bacterium]
MKFNDVLTLIFSSGALFFSFLNYKRASRFDNENFIYKTKVDIYVKILCELEKLIRFLEENIDDAKEYHENRNDENLKKLDELADEVDETCLAFNNFITDNSLIIPENIVRRLSLFCDKILDGETFDSETDDISKNIQIAERTLDELIKDADDISVELRKDLHVDDLNSTLYRRLKQKPYRLLD